VVDRGRVIARGTADELKAQVGGERLEIVTHDPECVGRAVEVLTRVGSDRPVVEDRTRHITVPVVGGAKLLAEVVRELDSAGVEIDDIALRRPTLDDVFLTLTGHAAEEQAQEEPAQAVPAGRSGR
jgi:ABC-2 type transport system ATP-binding protein